MRKIIFLLFVLSGLVACCTAASSTYEQDGNQASNNYESERALAIYEDEDFDENDYLPTIGEDSLDVHELELEDGTDEHMQNVDRYGSEEEDNESDNDDFKGDLQDLQPIVRMVRGFHTPEKTTPGMEPSLPHQLYRSSASRPQKKKTRRHPTRKSSGKKMKSQSKGKSGKKKSMKTKKAGKRGRAKKRHSAGRKRTNKGRSRTKKAKKRMEKKRRSRKKAKKASKKRRHIKKRRRSPKVKKRYGVIKHGKKTRRRGRRGRGRRPKRPRRPPYYVKPTRPATTTSTKPISTGYVGGQSGNYPAQCKCRETPRKNGICYDMYTPRKIGRCKRRSCSASFECVPGGGPRLKDCIRRVAKFEVRVIRSHKGKHRCRRVKLRRPKVFYTLYH